MINVVAAEQQTYMAASDSTPLTFTLAGRDANKDAPLCAKFKVPVLNIGTAVALPSIANYNRDFSVRLAFAQIAATFSGVNPTTGS